MRILFDIGHPAHVHYFRNLIKWLDKEKGETLVLARDKEMTYDLLHSYNIPFIGKGKGGTGILDRTLYTLKSLRLINRVIKADKPNLCISHASPYLAVMSKYHGIPHIMFNDTEKSMLFKPVVKYCKPDVYSPESFIGLDVDYQTPLPSYMELAYLHPDLFEASSTTTKTTGEDYILIRFVSNKASHDKGKKGLSDDDKRFIVRKLLMYKKVWISSEEPLPHDLMPYRLLLPPEKIHDVIAHASLVAGESATMSSEAAMLGVPSVLISHNKWGYIHELSKKYKLVHYYRNTPDDHKAALEKMISILKDENSRDLYQTRRQKMLNEKHNMTNLMREIIHKYLNKSELHS